MITHSRSPPVRAVGTRWFPPSDHFEIHGDGPESELTSRRRSVCDVFLFFCHFPIGCSGSGVVLIVSIPSLFFYTNTTTNSQEIPYTVLSFQIKERLVAHYVCLFHIIKNGLQRKTFNFISKI